MENYDEFLTRINSFEKTKSTSAEHISQACSQLRIR